MLCIVVCAGDGVEQVEDALSAFGGEERTAAGEGPRKTMLIVMRDETRTRPSSNTFSGDYKDLTGVATRIGTLSRLLPRNFQVQDNAKAFEAEEGWSIVIFL